VAPDEIPWPTAVVPPAYPSNAVGSGKVVLEVDISDRGAVTGTRVLTEATPFDVSSSAAVRQWKFRPAWRANREVASRAFFVFSFVGVTP
jgi:TonB family protein